MELELSRDCMGSGQCDRADEILLAGGSIEDVPMLTTPSADIISFQDRELDVSGLAKALTLQDLMSDSDRPAPETEREWRRDLIDGRITTDVNDAQLYTTLRDIMAWKPRDMPKFSPDFDNADYEDLVETIVLLLDCVAMKRMEVTRKGAWNSIGIPEKEGRGYLTGRLKFFRWPIFYTLREYAFRTDERQTLNDQY